MSVTETRRARPANRPAGLGEPKNPQIASGRPQRLVETRALQPSHGLANLLLLSALIFCLDHAPSCLTDAHEVFVLADALAHAVIQR